MRKYLPIISGLALAAFICLSLAGTALAAPTEFEEGGGGGTSDDFCAGDMECDNFFIKYINPLILVLSGLVGVAAVISIIIAGIQYSASADDPGTVSKAKQRVFNTIIGLVAYIFLLAFLNYLVPGGIRL